MAIFYGSKEHTAKMAELFKNEIEKSVKNSSVIRSVNYVPFEDNEVKVDIVVEDLTTSGAITKYKDLKNLCALNFASCAQAVHLVMCLHILHRRNTSARILYCIMC